MARIPIIPAVILEHNQHPVEKTRSLCFQLSWVEKWVVCRHHSQRDLQTVALEWKEN